MEDQAEKDQLGVISSQSASDHNLSDVVHNPKPSPDGIVLIPQPSSDPEDPLNWPLRKKLSIFASICLAGFAGQMSPNSNQLTFPVQAITYNVSDADMLNSVAAALAGWMAGPFLIAPLAGIIGRSAVIFWSLIGTFACQIWAANMTGPDDYILFTISRLICGMFGVMPAILGNGFIIDMFFLHQRGKAFAIFEVLIIFAVVGGGTMGGFIADSQPWQYVFSWTLGPVAAAIVAVFVFVHDTTFERATEDRIDHYALPKPWISNRLATFLPGTRTQHRGMTEVKRRAILPFKILVTPIMLLIGSFVFVALGLPIMQASSVAIYLMSPTAVGGYGFSSLRLAFFTMTAWVGMFAAQAYGYFFNDKIPLWISRRRGGMWHPEYRLANAIVPGILLPIALAIYGAGLHFHSHIMVLALASFLMWFAALLVLPVCYNYIVECFLRTPVEASIALNSYRISFGLMSVFVLTRWEVAVGVGWMWGMGSLFVVFVDVLMLVAIFGGHIVRDWTKFVSKDLAVTEDGLKVSNESRSG